MNNEYTDLIAYYREFPDERASMLKEVSAECFPAARYIGALEARLNEAESVLAHLESKTQAHKEKQRTEEVQQPIKWAELSKKERGRLILHAMDYFILENESADHRVPAFPRGIRVPDGFHWPIAFWNATVECWMTGDVATEPRFFDPLSDLCDAWKVLQKAIDRGKGYAHMTLYHGDGYLEIDVHTQNEHKFLPPVHVEHSTLTAPETLCLVALKSMGRSIE